MMPSYEFFEHEADIGIRGFGKTMDEAFEHAALGMYAIMVNTAAVQPVTMRTISVSAPDHELLLIEWLNALLTVSDIDRLVFSQFKVQIEGHALTGTAWGEKFDPRRHEPGVEVKAATYHLLTVTPADSGYVAQCIVDV
ncbi:MAG: archease [Nitrospirota bacterium]